MTYLVTWGSDGERTVSTAEELSTVLDEVAPRRGKHGAPYLVGVYLDDGEEFPPGVEVGLGHPDRAFVFNLGPGGGYGYEPGLDAWPEDIVFDVGGQTADYHPDQTRLTPQAARQAALEYVRTGQRPTCVEWSEG